MLYFLQSEMVRPKSTSTILPLVEDSRFRALVEKSSDVIMLMDAKGKILYATPSIVRLYGRSYDEFLGFKTFTFIHPQDIPKVMKQLGQLLLHPTTPVTVECRIKHSDGSWRFVEATGTNFLFDKQIKAIVVNFHDITERKLLEERKDEFISIASHELKSPLSALKNYLQFLQRKYDKQDERLQTTFSKMEQQMYKITDLVDTLLDVTRMQEGKIKLKETQSTLATVIPSVIEDLHSDSHRIRMRNISKKVFSFDEVRIAQVIENLLSNAIKYSPPGSTITIWCTEKKGYVTVHVKDQGIGIEKENIQKIFERFFQEQTSTQYRGLGLGLYICSTIIKLHGGTMFVTSRKNKGSVFTFTLPTVKKTQ